MIEQGDAVRPRTGRPPIYATQGVISSGHYLTSMAGMRMLLSGGNAFDAVVAAGFAAAVVEPIAAYSLAAEGVFMLYDAQSGQMLSLSGQGVAPGKATIEFYKSHGVDAIPTGPGKQAPLSFTVPGVVDAFISLLERFGIKSLGEVLAPAIHYAEYGIPHYEYMIQRLGYAVTKTQWGHFPPGGSEIFFDNGELPRPGAMLVQRSLARTLKKLVEAENAAVGGRAERIKAGRDQFYKGEIAELIVKSAQSVGGILSKEDLATYSAQYEEPIKGTYKGYEIYGQSSWTQGPMLMQTLNILENFDLKGMGHNSPQYIHTIIEALKLDFADRVAYYADPDFSTFPIDGLLSKEYAAKRAKLIDRDSSYPALPPPGDPWKHSKFSGKAAAPVAATATEGVPGGESSGTTHISVIDRDGNLVCATPSGGSFGKSVFFPELGCALSTRIEMFNLQEGHPNAVAPGKRPRTTLINYIVSKDGKP
ncbi:MAG: gamma-glutamyltransferase family protein, partial [Ardenticatenaceae bacterium]